MRYLMDCQSPPKAGALTRLCYAPTKQPAGCSGIVTERQEHRTGPNARFATELGHNPDTLRTGAFPIRSRGIYLDAYVPGHPMADKRGRVLLHRLIASETVGRPLRRDEHVHHINGEPRDNRPENLEILSPEAHNARHPQKKKPHGAESHYRRGCRCELCKAAHSKIYHARAAR